MTQCATRRLAVERGVDFRGEVAARHPFAEHGVIEVRPVWDE